MPDRLSEQVKLTVTFEAFQPFPFGPGVALAVMLGSVRSMLIPAAVTEELFPALSTAVPLADWPAPCELSVIGAVHEAMPDSPSLQVKLTVTVELCHPFAFAGGETANVIDGAVVSTTLTLNMPEVVSPPLSVTEQLTCVIPNGKTDPEAGEHVGVSDPSWASDAEAV
jgi:hypothetical protein